MTNQYDFNQPKESVKPNIFGNSSLISQKKEEVKPLTTPQPVEQKKDEKIDS